MDAAEILSRVADRCAHRNRSGAGGGRSAPLAATDLPQTLSVTRGLQADRDRRRRTATWTMRTRARAAALHAGPQRFVIAPSVRRDVVDRIRAQFPAAAARCRRARRPNRSLATTTCSATADLRFVSLQGDRLATGPDWHYDPVHAVRAAVELLVDRAVISTRLRRSQGHLGAQSPSALARARPRVLADRRPALPRRGASTSSPAGWTPTRRSSASTGRACWSSRSGRCRGCGRSSFFADDAGDDRRRRGSSICSSALDRQLAQIERNLSLLLQPEHAPARRSARAVRRRAGRFPGCARRVPRRRIGRDVLVERSPGRSAPTAATASARRTTTATRSTSICSRSPSPASHGDPAAAQFEDAAGRLGIRRAAARRRPRPAAAIGDDDGGSTLCRSAGRAADDDPRQPGRRRRARRPARSADRPGARGSVLAAAPTRRWRPPRPTRRRRSRAVGSAALRRDRLLRLAIGRRRSPRHRCRAARLSERRPRARRRAVADAHGRAACRCSSTPAPAATRSNPSVRDRLRSTRSTTR